MQRKSKNKLGLNLNLSPTTPENNDELVQQFVSRKDRVGRELSLKDFDELGDIGHGSSGNVTKVKHNPTGLIMARKTIQSDEKSSRLIANELQLLHECNSPFIVDFYSCVQSINGAGINIFMEYMDGGSLNHVMKKCGRFSEDILGKVTISVISGVKYLYEKHRIIHRDIKPSNILINSSGEIKLCDFGVSRKVVDSIANTFVGTQTYMAPERAVANEYRVSSDLWSLGLSLVELALGRYPIPPPSHEELQEIFGIQFNPALEPPEQTRNPDVDQHTRQSIFGYIQYIVNEPMPSVPISCFSPEFKEFVDACLLKEDTRPDYKTLETYEYYKRSEKEKVDVGAFVEQTIG